MDDRVGHDGVEGDGSGGPPEYEASRPGYWAAIDRKRRVGLIAIAVVVVLALALGSILALSDGPFPPVSGESTSTITPADPTLDPTRTVVGTYTAPGLPDDGDQGAPADEGAAPGSSGPSAPGGSTASPARAPLIVYRKDGRLFIAAEDGTGARQVAESVAGPHTLSPDGRTLALVDAETGVLSLVNAGTRTVTRVGQAALDPLAWGPDSAWLVYTAPGPVVRRVNSDGSGDVLLFRGSLPAVSSDGEAVVGVSFPSGDGAEIWRRGVVSRIGLEGPVTGLVSDRARLHYATGPMGEQSATLRVIGHDGRDGGALSVRPSASRPVVFASLSYSPDMGALAYVEHGDDGYSRLFVLDLGTGGVSPLSIRRDCYPLGWSADGESLFFIEGNAMQGESTVLVRAHLSSGIRETLVDGAMR